MDFLIITLKGFIIGFSIAAPVGPIGVLCISRTLKNGRLIGFFTGLGAATADAFYALVAAFGMSALTNFLVDHQTYLGIFGGIFLVILGIKNFFGSSSVELKPLSSRAKRLGVFSCFATTFLLTISNPSTILSFVAIFSGLQSKLNELNVSLMIYFVLGAFLGSATWWLILTTITGFFREKFNLTWRNTINKLSGIFIVSIGVYFLI